MPRLPELDIENAAPPVREAMEAQERLFGFVLNPIKMMGYCPSIAEGQAALTQGIEKAGNIEGRLRSLLFTRVASLNGCPF